MSELDTTAFIERLKSAFARFALPVVSVRALEDYFADGSESFHEIVLSPSGPDPMNGGFEGFHVTPFFDLNPNKDEDGVNSPALNINYSDCFFSSMKIANFEELAVANDGKVLAAVIPFYSDKWTGDPDPTTAFEQIYLIARGPGFGLNLGRQAAQLFPTFRRGFVLNSVCKPVHRYLGFIYRFWCDLDDVNPKIRFTLELGRYPL